jgi:hypothetical protein
VFNDTIRFSASAPGGAYLMVTDELNNGRAKQKLGMAKKWLGVLMAVVLNLIRSVR